MQGAQREFTGHGIDGAVLQMNIDVSPVANLGQHSRINLDQWAGGGTRHQTARTSFGDCFRGNRSTGKDVHLAGIDRYVTDQRFNRGIGLRS